MTEKEWEELLADACFVETDKHHRDTAWDCCTSCGEEYDAEHPPHYDVPRCKHGTRDCYNPKHFS